LKKFIPQKIRVRRAGVEKITEKKYLVPGDIVLLEAGDIVPADLKLVKASNLLIDESIATGESVPVLKYAGGPDKLLTGTAVVSGKAEAVVEATGENTFLGGIARAVSAENKASAYEKGVLYFSKLVLKI